MSATTNEIQSNVYSPARNKRQLWAGRIISTLPALFLVLDGVVKLFKPPIVVEATVKRDTLKL